MGGGDSAPSLASMGKLVPHRWRQWGDECPIVGINGGNGATSSVSIGGNGASLLVSVGGKVPQGPDKGPQFGDH